MRSDDRVAGMLQECIQEVGNLLVSAVDSKGSLSKAVLNALEGFINALASMPDASQFSRYQTLRLGAHAARLARWTDAQHGAVEVCLASVKSWHNSLQLG